MADFKYTLSYAGIPFLIDTAKVVRLPTHGQGETDIAPGSPKGQLAPRKHQPLADLVDEVDRLIPFRFLEDFAPLPSYPGRNVGALAYPWPPSRTPSPSLRVGDYFYPNGACRWSVFRGLATSAMVKEMVLATTGASTPTVAQFRMKAAPVSPDNPTGSDADYTIETNLYMLPPRPLGEHGGGLDGLYLVTLVDERFYWQYDPISLKVTKDSTWAGLISTLATKLGITITVSAIPAAYSKPEPDSQLWSEWESAPILLDAIAHSIGRVVVRNLAGTYILLTPTESLTRIEASRGPVREVVRIAGGDMFTSGTRLPVGSLTKARNAVVPDTVNVTFPKYVTGNDPVPHFLNARYQNQRPSCWYEEGYGAVHAIPVDIKSGGARVSGLVGISDHTIQTTAKAFYSTEANAASGNNPTNVSGLEFLARQIATDYYNAQVVSALDEAYPGTYEWNPEGIHDIVWTYSARTRMASTRVFRSEWNQAIREMQHSAPAVDPATDTNVPIGIGGPSVAQSWRDSIGSQTATLDGSLSSGAATATFVSVANLPTQNRWLGLVDNERILFEGTSGGLTVGIVYRGIDGTVQTDHGAASTVTEVSPHTAYGVNLVTVEKMQRLHPGAWTSGGISEAVIVPQTQTILVLSASGSTLGGIFHYSGRLQSYNPATPGFVNEELVWLVERNEDPVASGKRYDGQHAGTSLSGPVAPLYLANIAGSGSTGGGTTVASGTLQWFHFLACGLSGINCSGFIFNQHLASGCTVDWYNICSGAIRSGMIASGSIISGMIGSGTVTFVTLASGAVRSGHIGDDAVVSGSIASGQVGPPHIASGAINSGHISSGAVNSGNVVSGSITWIQLGSGSVRSGHIGDTAVTSGNYSSGSISALHVASGSLQWFNLGSGSVLSGHVGSGQIASGHIASGTIPGFAGQGGLGNVTGEKFTGTTGNSFVVVAAGSGLSGIGIHGSFSIANVGDAVASGDLNYIMSGISLMGSGHGGTTADLLPGQGVLFSIDNAESFLGVGDPQSPLKSFSVFLKSKVNDAPTKYEVWLSLIK